MEDIIMEMSYSKSICHKKIGGIHALDILHHHHHRILSSTGKFVVGALTERDVGRLVEDTTRSLLRCPSNDFLSCDRFDNDQIVV